MIVKLSVESKARRHLVAIVFCRVSRHSLVLSLHRARFRSHTTGNHPIGSWNVFDSNLSKRNPRLRCHSLRRVLQRPSPISYFDRCWFSLPWRSLSSVLLLSSDREQVEKEVPQRSGGAPALCSDDESHPHEL